MEPTERWEVKKPNVQNQNSLGMGLLLECPKFECSDFGRLLYLRKQKIIISTSASCKTDLKNGPICSRIKYWTYQVSKRAEFFRDILGVNELTEKN